MSDLFLLLYNDYDLPPCESADDLIIYLFIYFSNLIYTLLFYVLRKTPCSRNVCAFIWL